MPLSQPAADGAGCELPDGTPVDSTVVIGVSAAGYGRHAAPPSAYGPGDLHRMPPSFASVMASSVPPDEVEAEGEVEVEDHDHDEDDDADALVVPLHRGVPVPGVAVPDDAADPGPADDDPAKSRSFWARLRVLSKPA
jgi:hypothetical protein